jgi:hypothetical protein
MSENRMLRKMCGARRERTSRGWRRMHNEERYYPHQMKRNEMDRTCGACGEEESC